MIAEIIQGAVSGFVATAPMSGAMKFAHGQLPWRERYPLPPRQITMNVAKKLGVRRKLKAKEKFALTLLAHFGYGAAMGAIYGATCQRKTTGILSGSLFGLAVWLGSYLGVLPALGILSSATQHPVRRNALMIAAHIVWGSTVGALLRWLQSRDMDKVL